MESDTLTSVEKCFQRKNASIAEKDHAILELSWLLRKRGQESVPSGRIELNTGA